MVIVGQRTQTRRVDGGRTRHIECGRCGRPVLHEEHRVVHTATLFFLPVANVVQRTVWACTGCGTRVAEGGDRWLTGDQDGTAVGQVMAAVGTIAEEAGPVLGRLRRQVGAAMEAAFTEDAPAPPGPEPAEEVPAEPAPPRERPKRQL